MKETQEQWYKLCAILIHKQGLTEIQVTADDIDRFMQSGKANITIHPKGDVITLRLVSYEEGKRLAREAGGLPF